MSTRGISWGDKGGQYIGLTALSPPCADFLEILGASKSWSPIGLYRDCVTLPYHILILSVMFCVSKENIPFYFCSTFLAGMLS
jgi:hypothetical protein